ncbi:predicted protein [Histoplasma capsulatum var. duboisii H88]|uniref:Predicted protein n=1 Tax=Ajellomyces capsulatus (strain H88) TaxID=544711 RepID=F0UL42_AJEC8|nr:predicted protein [Histoplasma capsulatum var. duboisii H88]
MNDVDGPALLSKSKGNLPDRSIVCRYRSPSADPADVRPMVMVTIDIIVCLWLVSVYGCQRAFLYFLRKRKRSKDDFMSHDCILYTAATKRFRSRSFGSNTLGTLTVKNQVKVSQHLQRIFPRPECTPQQFNGKTPLLQKEDALVLSDRREKGPEPAKPILQ